MRGVWLVIVLVACSNVVAGEPAHELIADIEILTALGVDGDAIFWTTQAGDLFSAPKSGAPVSPAMRVTDEGIVSGSQLAFNEGAIYVATLADGVYRVDRLTSGVTQIDTGLATGVATNFGGDVYWSTSNSFESATTGVKRLALGAASPELLASDASLAVALDSAGVYWVDGFNLHWICIFCDPCADSQFPLRQRTNDGTMSTLATITPGYESLAADGEALYASDTCAGTITRFDHVSGATSVLASGFPSVGAMAIDDHDVYAVVAGKTGWFGVVEVKPAIVRVAKTGGAVTQLPIGDHVPVAVAVDADTVYFIGFDQPSGHYGIFAVAKPRP